MNRDKRIDTAVKALQIHCFPRLSKGQLAGKVWPVYDRINIKSGIITIPFTKDYAGFTSAVNDDSESIAYYSIAQEIIRVAQR